MRDLAHLATQPHLAAGDDACRYNDAARGRHYGQGQRQVGPRLVHAHAPDSRDIDVGRADRVLQALLENGEEQRQAPLIRPWAERRGGIGAPGARASATTRAWSSTSKGPWP